VSVPVAILWHQHQPYYKDLATGELVMPWVRLHGVKDYYGMAKLVEQCPGMRCTINLVPCMLAQLLDYVEHGATDPFLRHTELPAEEAQEKDAIFILDHFFMAQWDRMIRVHPRYGELLELRRFGRRSAQSALDDFSAQDLLDLQVWFNLAWFHPVSFEETPSLRELAKKARDFSEDDKQELLRVQREVLAQVVPLHAELVKRGQLELTTTPFYHPILPLLCDMNRAREAMPRTALPAGHVALADDAEQQVAQAVHFHTRIFGQPPAGMWPSEGSVAPEILPILARHGLRWLATDEEILSASLGTGLRGGFGRLERADLLYRGWRMSAGERDLNLVFRDHELSDLIGFQYQGWEGRGAADDFHGRLQREALKRPAGDETLISIILDGENCWEHYPDQGVAFLRALYARLAEGKGVYPSRVSEALEARPPSKRLDRLFSGSWINHDFYIWVGHAEDRKAWEYVFRVREDLVRETRRRGSKLPSELKADEVLADPTLTQAWEELYIAEGSDWFWWYGDDHTSGNDGAFDTLFRTHLKNIYRFLDLPAPHFLDEPVKAFAVEGRYTRPHEALRVTLDGRATSYFEWIGAGRYLPEKEGGVMTAATTPLVHQVLFGYDKDHLCVRVDFHEVEQEMQAAASASHPASQPSPSKSAHTAPAIQTAKTLKLVFSEPKGVLLLIEPGPPLKIVHEGPWKGDVQGARVAWDEVVEIQIPFTALLEERGKDVAFFVEAASQGGVSERFPRATSLRFPTPQENVEEQEWMV